MSAAPWQLDFLFIFPPSALFNPSLLFSAAFHWVPSCQHSATVTFIPALSCEAVLRGASHTVQTQRGWMSWKSSTGNYFKMSGSFQIIHRPANLNLQKIKNKKKTKNKKRFKYFLRCNWLPPPPPPPPFPHATVHLWQTAVARNSPVIAPHAPEQRRAGERRLECGRLLPNAVRGCKWTVRSWKCASHTDVTVGGRSPPPPTPPPPPHPFLPPPVLFSRRWTLVVVPRQIAAAIVGRLIARPWKERSGTRTRPHDCILGENTHE